MSVTQDRAARRADAPDASLATIAAPARVTLQISGMTCAACQARVQKALAAAPGSSTRA